MKPKLNQIIAIEKGTETRVYEKLTEDHKLLQRKELINGHARRYMPKDDDPTSPTGEQLPPENKRVQASAEQTLKETAANLAEFFDVSAARDWGNTLARADVVVDGKVRPSRNELWRPAPSSAPGRADPAWRDGGQDVAASPGAAGASGRAGEVGDRGALPRPFDVGQVRPVANVPRRLDLRFILRGRGNPG